MKAQEMQNLSRKIDTQKKVVAVCRHTSEYLHAVLHEAILNKDSTSADIAMTNARAASDDLVKCEYTLSQLYEVMVLWLSEQQEHASESEFLQESTGVEHTQCCDRLDELQEAFNMLHDIMNKK